MRIVEHTPQRLRLRGVPGGAVWMFFSLVLGLTTMAMSSWFAWASVTVSKSYLPVIPLGLGFLMGILFTSIGFLSLVFGRLTLTLDRVTGTGAYEVRSPVVDAGKPCRFELSQIHSVRLERSVLAGSRNDTNNELLTDRQGSAKFCTAVLRITPRRRKIILDETQNGREQRVSKVAQGVSDWLKLPLEVVETS